MDFLSDKAKRRIKRVLMASLFTASFLFGAKKGYDKHYPKEDMPDDVKRNAQMAEAINDSTINKPTTKVIKADAKALKKPQSKTETKRKDIKIPATKTDTRFSSDTRTTLDEIFTRYESGNLDYKVGKEIGKNKKSGEDETLYYFGRYQFNSQHVKAFCEYMSDREEYKTIAADLRTSKDKKKKDVVLSKAYVNTEEFKSIWSDVAEKHDNFSKATVEYAQSNYFPRYFEEFKYKLSQDKSLPNEIRHLDFDKVNMAVFLSWKSAMIQHSDPYVPIFRSLANVKSIDDLNSAAYIKNLYEQRNQRTSGKYKTRYKNESAEMIKQLNITPTQQEWHDIHINLGKTNLSWSEHVKKNKSVASANIRNKILMHNMHGRG